MKTIADPRRRHLLALAALAPLVPAPSRAQATEGALWQPWPPQRPAPPLALAGYDGPGFDLAQARGQVVLLNFWASWCEPCRSEMPSLELLAQRHEAQRLVVIAVNHRESEAAIRRFMTQLPISLPIVRDADGAASRAWGVRVFPTTVVIGRDGRALLSVVGEVDWGGDAARRRIAALL